MTTRKSQNALDRLSEAMRRMPAERALAVLRGARKDTTLGLRISTLDKQDVAQAARRLNLTVSEYLIRAHFLVSEVLKEAKI